jgi:hypothetical protein
MAFETAARSRSPPYNEGSQTQPPGHLKLSIPNPSDVFRLVIDAVSSRLSSPPVFTWSFWTIFPSL